MKKSVYVLNTNGPVIQFYVGCTSDTNRRFSEHRNNSRNPNHAEYNTNKYKFIRELDAMNLSWSLTILTDEIMVDEKTDEYSWILKIARENESNDISFDGNPLTNMKAGDFLDEMLADKSLSTDPQSVKKWLTKHKNDINYTRDILGRNRELFASVNVEAQERNRQERLKEIKSKDREIKRLKGVIENWEILGFDYAGQELSLAKTIEERAKLVQINERK